MPVYRALTIAGNVLERDEFGDVHHILVMNTTSEIASEVIYRVVGTDRKK